MSWSNLGRCGAITLIACLALEGGSGSAAASGLPYAGPRIDVTLKGAYDPGHLGPVVVGESPNNEATLQVFADGSIKCFYAADGKAMSIRSIDGGVTWGKAATEFEFAEAHHYPRRTLLDRDGEVHMMFFNKATDIFHVKTSGGGKAWGTPRKITNGRIGAIRCLTRLPSGRILLCFHRRVRATKPPTGACFTTAIYSDDAGKTWTPTETKITAPVRPDFNGNNYGAVEPTITRLGDGRLWTLMRSQTGFLYQSFSQDDGETWTEGEASIFASSNSPPHFLRLPDGRLVLIWNNCRESDIKTFGRIYTNRDALHMAISDDDGRTWRGFRELYLDPGRNSHEGLGRGDSGTAYPNAVFTKQGKILVATGQRDGLRGMVLVDPQWLYETEARERFDHGLDRLCAYTFVATGSKPLRRQGPAVIPHPDDPRRNVVHVRKADEHYGDALMWNFPLCRAGEAEVTLCLAPGSSGLALSLTDHYTHPNDPAGVADALFAVSVGRGQALELAPGQWRRLRLKWDIDAGWCDVSAGAKRLSRLELMRKSRTGICYLRLGSPAFGGAVDRAGTLVSDLRAKAIEPHTNYTW